MSACDDCLLRYRPVTPTGTKKARFLIVSKGVSHSMGMKKQNITPASMKMLAKHMKACGFVKSDFVFANSVQCGYDPKQWRAKDKRIIEKSCREHLVATIKKMKPEVIVPLGAEAASAVAGRAVKITKVRGIVEYNDEHEAYVLPMLDPTLAVRYPQNEPLFASDCKVLERIVEYDYDIESAEKDVMGDYKIIDDLQFLIDMEPEELAFDLETKGTRWKAKGAKILTMQFSVKEGEGYALVWDHPGDPVGQRAKRRLIKQLKQLLQNPNTSVIGQNGKFDMVWVYHMFGFWYRLDHDTIMLAALVDENMLNKDLDTLTKIYAPEMAGYADSFNKEFDKSMMDLVPLPKLIDYGGGDTDACLRVFHELISIVESDEKLYNHYRKVAMPGINAFARIDHRGMMVDEEALDDFEEVLAEYVENLRKKIMGQIPKKIKRKHVQAGLKLSRPDFIRDILFRDPDGFNLTPRVFTETTENLKPEFQVPSTSSKKHLPYFFDECPFTIDLADWMKTDRLLGTSVRRFRENYIVDGYVNPIYGLWTAVTGRTNSRDPNGQNFPKRGKYAKAYRKIFVPPPGFVILEADLSQAELRIAAEASGDETMRGIYVNNGDIHLSSALIATGLTLKEFKKLPKEEQDLNRFKAKAINFGFLYGMWWKNFIVYAKTQYGVEFTAREAERIRKEFFKEYNALEPWHKEVKKFAMNYGYVRSYDGRIRHLPMLKSSDESVVAEALRQAINSPVQNFGSDLGVMSVSRIDREIDEQYMAPTGFVHDAIYVLVREQHVEWGAKTLKWYMESNPLKEWFGLDMGIPIIADVGFGWNAGETHEMVGLKLDEKYDFSKIDTDDEGNRIFTLPKQTIPPNDGRKEILDYLQVA